VVQGGVKKVCTQKMRRYKYRDVLERENGALGCDDDK
jgi:hypothetical protein